MASKGVKTPEGCIISLVQETHSPGMLACCNCGKAINKGDYFTACSDCGGVFCETCVTDGEFDHHVCDDNDPAGSDDHPW